MNEKIYQNLAQSLGLWCKTDSNKWCDLVDVENDLSMSIEFIDSNDGLWVWTCQAVVGDIPEENAPNPWQLLVLNNGALLWCYHAIHPFEEDGEEKRLSLNLKYTFATPANDLTFAQRLLGKVLYNMRECALKGTRQLLKE